MQPLALFPFPDGDIFKVMVNPNKGPSGLVTYILVNRLNEPVANVRSVGEAKFIAQACRLVYLAEMAVNNHENKNNQTDVKAG